jgi:uncharacterized membrane protein
MNNNHSSNVADSLANSSGWAFAIIITILAAVAIFEVFVSMQTHLYEEVASLSINQMVR